MEKKIRLSKLLSHRKICSRRDADRFIERGLVRVNGKILSTLGVKVDPDVYIELLPSATKTKNKHRTLLLNKPVGYVSNQPEKGYPAAIELICPENQFGSPSPISFHKTLSVAGRLDIDSKGLLVLTQDGVIAKELIGENSDIEKEYIVHVERDCNREKIEKLRFGMELDGKPLKRAEVSQIGPQVLRFILREGKKRQIRRMCLLVDLKVTGIKRVRIGKIFLAHLPEGRWRILRPSESF